MLTEPTDYEQTFKDFWESLVCRPDGALDPDAVKRELHDYRFLMQEAGKVYCEVTGDRVSKVNTMAFEVIAEHNRVREGELAERERETREQLLAERHDIDDALRRLLGDLKTQVEPFALAATPGPWGLDEHGDLLYSKEGGRTVADLGITSQADRRYIAALHPRRMLALVAAVQSIVDGKPVDTYTPGD